MEVLTIIAILPVFLLCFYIYKKDKDKEPAVLLRKVFLFGMLSTIPILIIELILNQIISFEDNFNLVGLFIAVLVGVGLIEEFFKWLVVYTKVYNHKEFNHAYDAIVYAVFASLGFALIENFLFVFSNGLGVGLMRALLTVPSHACNAIIMGFYFGKAKYEEYKGNQKESNKFMLYSLVFPILAHTIYDFLLFSERNLLYVLFVIFIISLYMKCFKLIKKVAAINYNFDGTPVTYKSIDEIKVIPGNGPQKHVNSLESALYAVNKTVYICVIAIFIAICALLFLNI